MPDSFPFEILKPDAKAELSESEFSRHKIETNDRINLFIHNKMFQSGVRVSDISYDYINHFYELFPNFRLHTELISKTLLLLSDITTERHMH